MTTQAERIRQFVLDQYITPARTEGRSEIVIRAGDVHQAMALTNAMPAVCSAIGANRFREFAKVTPIKWSGPANGANAYFHFSLVTRAESMPAELFPQQKNLTREQMERDRRTVAQPTTVPALNRIDLNNALVLVSCVKSKLAYPAPARSLYTSTWFIRTRDIVEGSGARWFVLSSLYGLVVPDAQIAPYDYTLNTLSVSERRNWANRVIAKLMAEIRNERRIVMFAGHRYREFLVEPLERRGITVEVPMANLTRGEQLSWLCTVT